ncbi:hypothetical protein SLEP1_g58462 [Rubroshorea leprosula]|uniref:Uncharacterized protein n=1 Tax=Rubroshorea leprosula TaxID=152421 RepID=A0AAV5MQW1_9ROSI|nr:hypothetical protein SLEP1_g58462 [Rubroshorea leprosula]
MQGSKYMFSSKSFTKPGQRRKEVSSSSTSTSHWP